MLNGGRSPASLCVIQHSAFNIQHYCVTLVKTAVLPSLTAFTNTAVQGGMGVLAGMGSGLIEVGDGCTATACAEARLVEQVDVVAAGAAARVQVFVDGYPALRFVVALEVVECSFVIVANDHHVGDERCGRCREAHGQHHEQG